MSNIIWHDDDGMHIIPVGTSDYVPDHELPHCETCGDPWSAHDGFPRRHGAKCTRCDCAGYEGAGA